MNTIEKIIDLMQNKKVNAINLTNTCGLNHSAITDWKSGKAKPSADALLKIADYFEVSVDYLLGRTEYPQPSNVMEFGRVIKMPVIGAISAGYNGFVEEEILDEIGILEISLKGYSKDECFLLKVSGNSMYPDFLEGDIVAVHKQPSVESGEIAIILYNGDAATIKKVEYKQGKNWMKLIPPNPEYETKLIEGEDLELCRVLGRVISLVHRSIA